MIVSSRAGAYLADMHVRIIGANSQKVLDAPLGAPWLLVDLIPGSYTVSVTHSGGQTHERKVTIAAGKREQIAVQFDVPADTARESGSPVSPCRHIDCYSIRPTNRPRQLVVGPASLPLPSPRRWVCFEAPLHAGLFFALAPRGIEMQ